MATIPSTATTPHWEILDKKELAERLKLPVRSIEVLVQHRKIPVIKLGYRTHRFDWQKVEAAMAKLTVSEV
jgi:excisionase family DNA binding protein